MPSGQRQEDQDLPVERNLVEHARLPDGSLPSSVSPGALRGVASSRRRRSRQVRLKDTPSGTSNDAPQIDVGEVARVAQVVVEVGHRVVGGRLAADLDRFLLADIESSHRNSGRFFEIWSRMCTGTACCFFSVGDQVDLARQQLLLAPCTPRPSCGSRPGAPARGRPRRAWLCQLGQLVARRIHHQPPATTTPSEQDADQQQVLAAAHTLDLERRRRLGLGLLFARPAG